MVWRTSIKDGLLDFFEEVHKTSYNTMWNTEMVSPLFSLIWWWAFQTNVYESTFFSFSKQRRRGAEASEVLQWCWNKCQFVQIADGLKALFFNLQVMYSNFPWAKYSQKRAPISLKCFTARVIGNKFSTGKATFSFSLPFNKRRNYGDRPCRGIFDESDSFPPCFQIHAPNHQGVGSL